MARNDNSNAAKKRRRKEKLFLIQGGRCAYCRHQFHKHKLTIDHIKRLKDGGDNHISNLVLACEPCNAMRELPAVVREAVVRRWKKRHEEYVQLYADDFQQCALLSQEEELRCSTLKKT